MVEMRRLNQFLKDRKGRWHYQRRVPRRLHNIDPRGLICMSLRTGSLEVARARRDALAEADELYWAALSTQTSRAAVEPAVARYRAAKARAMARGYVYTPIDDLAQEAQLGELLKRLKDVEAAPQVEKPEAEALLGAAAPAAPKISEAFEIYCDQIAAGDLVGKSPSQLRLWKKTKKRAIINFIALHGDMTMDVIERKHAQEFYNWWGKRLKPKNGEKARHPNSANKDIGNLRTLYQRYWEFEGEETRENPFRRLRFTISNYKDIPPFDSEWMKTRILAPGVFDDLNEEARLIIYAMVETGCRPSEIANLMPENIVLNHDVPHLQIRHRDDRKLKSNSSVRDIPLLGVSLEAFKQAPNGFPRYRNKEDALSALLLKAFKARKLFPTPDHRIYSIRHTFEKRMLEAGLDYGLRCTLMGHHNNRPEYGDGGSLEYRRDEMAKAIFDVSINEVG